MKRYITFIFIIICAVLLPSGCGDKSTVTGVSMAAQEYVGASIYELPQFDGEGAAVAQLNADISSQLTHYISGWEVIKTDDSFWYELRSYPICSQRYKQVVVTAIELPNYGTDGDVFSFCYDTKTGAALTLDDALEQAGVSRETAESYIRNRMADYLSEGDMVINVSCPAFAFAGNELYIIARAFIENDLTSEHDELFVYNVAQDAMYEYTGAPLFPAGLCDQTEPPLSYGRE